MIDMEQSIEDVLLGTLARIKIDPSLSVSDALIASCNELGHVHMHAAAVLIKEAMLRPELGRGVQFQDAIVERALHATQANRSRELVRSQRAPAVSGQKRNDAMSDNVETKAAAAARVKKYNVGDTFNTVTTMGLQVTDANRKATCGYQFSRKTARDGTMDLPEGTPVRYLGARAVYEGQSSTKRMIFKVARGTPVFLNGTETVLDNDIEIAGVVNHVDADDPYNVQARENDAKRAEKARIKAVATAATKAA